MALRISLRPIATALLAGVSSAIPAAATPPTFIVSSDGQVTLRVGQQFLNHATHAPHTWSMALSPSKELK